MKTSISSLVRSCLALFSQIAEKVEQSYYNNLHGKDVPAISWIDELGRLRIWAANIGAHQTGQSSLDFRLRDSSHITDEIIDLLTDLSGKLDEVADFISDNTISDNHLETDPTTDLLDEPSLTEIQQLYEEVVTIVKCLYQMSMLIRNPARHNLLAESVPDDILMSDQWDRQHVSNKFPQADNRVIEHLGRANTRRRKYFKYRERHSAKLSRGLEHDPDTDKQTMSSTMATEFKADIIDPEDTASNSGFSQTSYAQSLFEGGNITIPPLPKEYLAGTPFVCPYCHFVIDVHNTRSWTRHIFKDLKPYSCTFPNCCTIDRLYASRTEWFFHVRNTHDVSNLQCPLCKDILISPKFFERHVARHLEELALFVLPRIETDVGDDHGNEALSTDSESEHNSAAKSSHYESIKGAGTIDEESGFTANRIRDAEAMPIDVRDQTQNELDSGAFEYLGTRNVLEDPEHKLPEDPSSVHKGVMSQEVDMKGIPPNARWTKIDRKLVSLQALDEKGERYEAREDYVLVQRVLAQGEIEELADRTRMIRSYREWLPIERDMESENEMIIAGGKAAKKSKEEQIRKTAEEEKFFWENLEEVYLSPGYHEDNVDTMIGELEKEKKEPNRRPTYIKVHRKHLSPETLDAYNLPWKWDDV